MSKSQSISMQLASRYWTETDARAVIDALSMSGMSVAAFAQQEGLDAERLYRWRRRLNATESPPQPSAFVEVRSLTATLVEIVLRSDRVLRVPESIDGQALLRLVELLERDCPC